MNEYLVTYIQYRVEKSEQAYTDAIILAEAARWNGAVNRLYYSCYYIVSALILKESLEAKTHAGLKNQFNQHFVKNGKKPLELGKLYSDLFVSRQKGDYGDFYDFDKDTVNGFLEPVKKLIDTAKDLLNTI